MEYLYQDYVSTLKALGDETRIKIFVMLSSGEMCACEILEFFNITQPTLSYHMKILTESNLVTSVRDGAWMRYRINKSKFIEINDFCQSILAKI